MTVRAEQVADNPLHQPFLQTLKVYEQAAKVLMDMLPNKETPENIEFQQQMVSALKQATLKLYHISVSSIM